MMTPIDKQSFGMAGCVVVEGGGVAPTGVYCAIQFVSATTIISLTSATIGNVVAIEFPAGFVLYGLFTGLEIDASGLAICYKASA